ncbi:hypothetical protein [Streptomyces violaceusniger]|uniref:Uncharacterized protein n=1 Tax=Streptomyces violaceusniger TaxID=68280 RepID=A0A4D4L4A0_STRVO|nr:hypothetical protein SVIO_070740 [Streptomyces violaceusniger]
MYKRLEAVGTRLLARLVPTTEAAASAAGCSWNTYPSCWQCGYGPCTANCCSSGACPTVICF